MNGNLQLDPLSAASARPSTAKGFLFLSFSLDKYESGNKQQKGNIRITWKTYDLPAGTQAEMKKICMLKKDIFVLVCPCEKIYTEHLPIQLGASLPVFRTK